MVINSSENILKKSAVVDSSSAIILYKCGIFEKTARLFNLLIPNSVRMEITQIKHSGADYFIDCIERGNIKVVNADLLPIESCRNSSELNSLGAGECETIDLYINGTGDFIIIDDRKGASICRKRNLKYINALLIPRVLFLAGVSSREECNQDFSNIINLGRYSSWVIDYASSCADEKLLWYVQR